MYVLFKIFYHVGFEYVCIISIGFWHIVVS